MKILSIGFTNAPFFYNDVKKEAESRGHTMDFCQSTSLNVDIGPKGIDARAGGFDLKEFDLIHAGSMALYRWPLITTFGYLNRTNGCAIVDGRLIDAKLTEYSGVAKYFIEQEHGINFPRSVFFKSIDAIEDKIKEFEFPVIIKTNSSSQGRGVGKADNIEELKEFVRERLARSKNLGFILRDLIPNDGVYRVNVIDNKAIACLKISQQVEGEFRSCMRLGGKMTNAKLEDHKEICAIAEKIVKLSNYDIAGVDVIVNMETGVPYILEVNRAPGCLHDDVEVSGIDIAKHVVDMYEKRFAEKKN